MLTVSSLCSIYYFYGFKKDPNGFKSKWSIITIIILEIIYIIYVILMNNLLKGDYDNINAAVSGGENVVWIVQTIFYIALYRKYNLGDKNKENYIIFRVGTYVTSIVLSIYVILLAYSLIAQIEGQERENVELIILIITCLYHVYYTLTVRYLGQSHIFKSKLISQDTVEMNDDI